MKLRYTKTGYIIIMPGDDCAEIIDLMLHDNCLGEFCAALCFDPGFVAELMAAGFLVMSARFAVPIPPGAPPFFLWPKFHGERSVVFFPNLRETKTARRLVKRYELRFDVEFDRILDRCVETHGDGWLTPPLLESFRQIRAGGDRYTVRLVSFGLYREGKLVAGEFGVIAGMVYTSYSGYRDEDSSGTIQLILTGRWLRDEGFAFWDLGMPLPYKKTLGAVNISPARFAELFRGAQSGEA